MHEVEDEATEGDARRRRVAACPDGGHVRPHPLDDAQGGAEDLALAQAPEAESPYGKADPDEYLDLKQSSASAVTRGAGQARQAQAADVPAAANGIAWQQIGPYNIGGRVIDVAPTLHAQRRLRGGLGRRRLEERRRRRELDVGLARRPTSDDGRAGAGRQRHAVGRHRRGQPARRRPDLLRRRHLQVDRQRRPLDQHGADARARRSAGSRSTRRTRQRVFAAASGPRRAHRPRSAACTARSTAARPGSSCSPRRTRRPARSTSRSTRRTRRSSTRRCGTTRATTARASTAASAPACSAPRTAATRGSAWRTSSTRCRRTTPPQTGLKSGREPRPHRRRRSRRANPNRVYVVSGSPYGPDKGFYFSDDGGDSFHVGGRAYQTSERLPVVVRPPVGRPGRTRTTSSTRTSRCARRPTAARPGRRSAARTPTSTAMDWDPHHAGRTASTSATTAACTAPTATASTARGSKATNQPWNQSLPPRRSRSRTRSA